MQPVLSLLGRQPAGEFVSASVVTYRGFPSSIASPFKWQRSSAAQSVTKGGRQCGTKLKSSCSDDKHENSVFTCQSFPSPHASSCPCTGPVKCADRVRKHASCFPAGAIRAARSGADRKYQTCRFAPTATPSGTSASPITCSKL